jgi:hypothetical protein
MSGLDIAHLMMTESTLSSNIKLLSINTYVSNYNDFITAAEENLIKMNNTTKLGAGILSSNNIPEEDMIKVAEWLSIAKINTMNIWSSNISPFAYKGLYNYLNK